MTPNLKISQSLINRLAHVKEKCFSCLYGIIYDNCILVLGFLTESSNNELNLLDSFPAEIDFCGVIGIAEDEYNCPRAKKLLQDVDVTDNPLFLSYKLGQTSSLTASFIVHGKTEDTTFDIYSEAEIYSQFIIVRLQTRLPFMCNFQKDLVQEASTNYRKQLASGAVVFQFPKTSVYLTGSDSENGLTGLSGEPDVGELCDYTASDGSLNVHIKRKEFTDIDVLLVNMLRKVTKDISDTSNDHAPIIDVNKRIYECLSISLKIDAIAMVHRSTKVFQLYQILIESLCRNLRCVERCLVKQMIDQANDDNEPITLSLPEPFHFMPKDCGHLITRFYAKNATEIQLERQRKMLHDQFLLPKTWPYFKRTNVFIFKEVRIYNGPLINPHENISKNNAEGEICVVRGKYSYYHYMQNNFDDSGWGCAYRSLQTLFSWYRLQGYTEKPVPTHREIQQCLVNIKDKPDRFIGSRQWIGSTEVSFCLETMLGVTCRILHAHSGEDVASQGPELVTHFKTQGTPVMIGGGQLAHTILGVDYNQSSGNIRFLILDPHYTGGEDLHVVISKGWCGWKTVNFWNKSSYYNMCLPQVPRCI